MTTTNLIPQQEKQVSRKERILLLGLSFVIGLAVSAVGWLATDDLTWLYAIPIVVSLGVGTFHFRPNILWGNRAP